MSDDDQVTESRDNLRNMRLLIYLSLAMAGLCFAHQAIALIGAWRGLPAESDAAAHELLHEPPPASPIKDFP